MKITKKVMFEEMTKYMLGEDTEVAIEEMIAFCQHETEALENRAAKSAERRTEKKVKEDVLLDKVRDLLTEDWVSIADMTALINDEEVSSNKVAYRLNALVSLGVAKKEDTTITGDNGKNKKVKVYALA